MKLKFLISLFIGGICFELSAQKTATLIYIDQYKDIAIKEMKRTGIPASITLAQGIVESNSGQSNLAANFNNHFGIKCKLDWKGETTYQDDDAKQECFRVYPNAQASFIDHSNFIKSRPNYAPLFLLDPVDDSAWTIGLKKAGYATASDYSKKLMKVIDDFELSQFNFPELNEENDSTIKDAKLPITKTDTVDLPIIAAIPKIKVIDSTFDKSATKDTSVALPTIVTVPKVKISDSINNKTTTKESTVAWSTITPIPKIKVKDSINSAAKVTLPKKEVNNYPKTPFKINQVTVIWAKAGSSLLQIATEHHIPLYKIFIFNDLKESDLLANDQLLFLSAKKTEGSKSFHTVSKGETLYDISQMEGIQLKKLKEYNPTILSDTLTIGTTLILMKPKEPLKKIILNK
ncbi:MAG: glucosaminidase domain-containing protein [Bacteroidetes bacterium]|nr:glucosaminidase domain-containing protein [Bacteroidota bacterium]